MLVWLSQIGVAPQQGEGAGITLSLVVGVLASRGSAFTARGGVMGRVQHRNEIGAFFRRAIKRPAGIDARIAPVGGDLVMQIMGWSCASPTA